MRAGRGDREHRHQGGGVPVGPPFRSGVTAQAGFYGSTKIAEHRFARAAARRTVGDR
jgi:hypothetical protein